MTGPMPVECARWLLAFVAADTYHISAEPGMVSLRSSFRPEDLQQDTQREKTTPDFFLSFGCFLIVFILPCAQAGQYHISFPLWQWLESPLRPFLAVQPGSKAICSPPMQGISTELQDFFRNFSAFL
jgi:hypothetical protein